MKHTIKVSLAEAITIEPTGDGQVKLSALVMGLPVGSRIVTREMLHAVLIAGEQVAADLENRQARAA